MTESRRAWRSGLNGRTRNRTVAAKDAAIASCRFQSRMTARAIVEKEASVRGHRLLTAVPTVRTGDDRLQDRLAITRTKIVPNGGDEQAKQPAIERARQERAVERVSQRTSTRGTKSQ